MKLSKPQTEIMQLLNNGGVLRNSKYFYGFRMTLKGGEDKYFRRDTIQALLKKGLIKYVVHICGEYLEINYNCDC